MSGSRSGGRGRWLRLSSLLTVALVLMLLVAACGGDDDDDDATATSGSGSAATPTAPAAATEPAEEEATEAASPGTGSGEPANLSGVKDYALMHAQGVVLHATDLAALAEEYAGMVEAAGGDYATLADDGEAVAQLIEDAKTAWIASSTDYEFSEGIVAGVPSLADFDVWLDAGPSGEEDPAEARDWNLELPDGTVLEKPGNLYHSLLEPTIWGTKAEFVGGEVDLDGDGEAESLPDAGMFVAASETLVSASTEMVTAIEDWEPNQEDVFTALTTMIPTMNEYFEQWKLSAFVAGEENAEETAFVAVSRLLDINGILTGLDLAYDLLSSTVAEADVALDEQILTGFDDLVSFVSDLYEQEQGGTVFTPEDADLFGSEAQDKATALAGQVAQAAALLGVEIAE